VAEYFRDVEGQDVLVFIDNIFGSRRRARGVGALGGCRRRGLSADLATEMGELQERITSTKKARSRRCRRFYVRPTTLPTRHPRPVLAPGRDRGAVRQIFELGIYPAVDPLASVVAHQDAQYLGERHYNVAVKVQRILQRYKDLQDIIAILGMDELSEEDKQLVARAAPGTGASSPNRSSWPRSSRASRAST